MALPFVFANVSVLLTTSLDSDFNALGAMATIPCTASGTNTIALTPNSNTPTIAAYTTMSPIFAFIAAGSNSGATTVNVSGVGAKTLYKTGGANAVGSGDIISGSLYLVNYNPALNSSAGGFVLINPSVAQSAPTVTRLTSGTAATYTAPAGCVRQRIRMVAAGGGGGATVTNSGANGTSSSFQVNATGTAWTAVFGNGGTAASGAGSTAGGAGGTGGVDGSTGTLILRIAGTAGSNGANAVGGAAGVGGITPLGGAAVRPAIGVNPVAGANAGANSGCGGNGGQGGNSGGGGGAGEYVEFWVTGCTTATYTVGAAGAGGAAGTNAGGNGAAGWIVIEEFYI